MIVKRLIQRSLSIGAYIMAALIIVEFVFTEVAALRQAGEKIAIFLYPGTALILALGNNRLDDVDFWGMAMIVNWFFYSSACFIVLRLIDRLNVRSGEDGSR